MNRVPTPVETGKEHDLRGKAWKFGDNVSTDLIAPGRYFHLRSNLPELAKHVLEDADASFPGKVQPGDFVVGGRNFGCGSSREHAPAIIKMAGVQAVVAQTFARIFFRNAINVGLPVVTVDTSTIETGDELELDLAAGILRNVTRSRTQSFPPLPEVMRKILDEGGLAAFIRAYGALEL